MTTPAKARRPAAPPGPAGDWRHSWRVGYQPLLSNPELRAMRDGLRADDPALVQGLTASGAGWHDFLPCDRACALGYAYMRSHPGATLRQVRDRVFDLVAACRADGHAAFLAWFDDAPRGQVVPALLAEVEAELDRRKAA